MQAQGHAAEEAFGEGLGERIGLRRSGNGGGQPVADLGDIELIAQGDALHPLALAAGVGGVASQGAARRVDQRDGVALAEGRGRARNTHAHGAVGDVGCARAADGKERPARAHVRGHVEGQELAGEISRLVPDVQAGRAAQVQQGGRAERAAAGQGQGSGLDGSGSGVGIVPGQRQRVRSILGQCARADEISVHALSPVGGVEGRASRAEGDVLRARVKGIGADQIAVGVFVDRAAVNGQGADLNGRAVGRHIESVAAGPDQLFKAERQVAIVCVQNSVPGLQGARREVGIAALPPACAVPAVHGPCLDGEVLGKDAGITARAASAAVVART